MSDWKPKAAYHQIYWSDFLSSTMTMSDDGAHAYLFLLGRAWEDGGYLKDDDRFLCRAARMSPRRWAKCRHEVLERFERADDGTLYNARIIADLRKVNQKREIAKHNSESRWSKKSNENNGGGDAGASVSQCSPTPTPYKKDSPPSPTGMSPPKGGTARKRGARLPDDWTVSEKNRTDAVSIGMNTERIAAEADKFRDYWHAKAGRDATKLDWDATWRNWCRRAAEKQGNARSYGHARKPVSILEAARQSFERGCEEWPNPPPAGEDGDAHQPALDFGRDGIIHETQSLGGQVVPLRVGRC